MNLAIGSQRNAKTIEKSHIDYKCFDIQNLINTFEIKGNETQKIFGTFESKGVISRRPGRNIRGETGLPDAPEPGFRLEIPCRNPPDRCALLRSRRDRMPRVSGFRGCRFARPPANGWHPSGMGMCKGA